jgi:hypothetical protein
LCAIATRGSRLFDALADSSSEYLSVRDVEISETKPGKPPVRLREALIHKADIVVAILPRERHEAPEKRRYARVDKTPSSAFMLVENYKVRGTYHSERKRDARSVLTVENGQFLPLTEVRIDLGGEGEIASPVAFVNRSLVSLLAISAVAND